MVEPLSPSRYKIQFTAIGRGGAHDPDQLSLMCKRHNIYFAEREYGKELMKRYRRKVEGVSETAPGFVANGDNMRPWGY